MSEDPDGISRRVNAKDDSPSENQRCEAPLVNHRAKQGGDPEGTSPEGDQRGEASMENQQGEALVVNAKDDSPSENRLAAGPSVMWEALLLRAGCGERVIAHARAVTALALSFTRNTFADRDLVEAGAMLHDIGRGTTHGIAHAQRGADMARSYGLDPAIVAIIERHLGAGLTADEGSLVRLSPRDCMPVTLEERIVANADNLVHGNKAGSIERTLWGAPYLKRRIRRRIYRLWLEMEGFR
jgi:uncharacterized protein